MMWKALLCYSLAFLFVADGINKAKYCDISPNHTMCLYKELGPGCGTCEAWDLTDPEINQIVELHNTYRAKIAQGLVECGQPGPQPKAANMQQLVWDKELAEVAQRWADQCTVGHDTCRDDPRFKVGQSIYWTSASKAATFTRAIDLWYAEVARMNSSWVSSYQSNVNTGHYTQLAWARTNRIGCARRAYGAPSYRYSRAARPELVLSPSSSSSLPREKRQQAINPGYFGGAQYDPSGAQGAVTHHNQKPVITRPPMRPPTVPPTQRPTFGNNMNNWFLQANYNPQYWGNYGSQVYRPEQGTPLVSTTSNDNYNAGMPNVTELPKLILMNVLSTSSEPSHAYSYEQSREQILICNYGPRGNEIGEPVYEIGEPCSNCPSDTSTCINGMCA